jgi:DNA repair protein RadA/Sms
MLCAMEGSRPLLVEVQALVAPTDVVPPRRIANGIDRNRLSLVLAVLSRHVGRRVLGNLTLSSSDVFVNLVEAFASRSPAPTWPSRLRSRPPHRAYRQAPAIRRLAVSGRSD